MHTLIVVVLLAVAVAIRDITQKKHTIRRNFPIIGNFRYWLEEIGPELRQYFVENNREGKPFARNERTWIYASSKNEPNTQGFGSDTNFEEQGHIFINNVLLAKRPNGSKQDFFAPKKVIGPNRARPYHPKSVINISGMSYGALSAKAVEALNKGAAIGGCYHNTGEGGFSEFHNHGADVVFQFGTGYFGVRNDDNTFSLEKLVALVQANPCIRAIEIKLSQGAKPGKGGLLPGKKVTKAIAKARAVPEGKDVHSPSYHTAFGNMQELVDLIEQIAEATGLPVGIKAAVGHTNEWTELGRIMYQTHKGPDFITIDGGEGGTGAAPQSFTESVSLPFVHGFAAVYKIFQTFGLEKQVVFIGSGKLGLPQRAIMAFAMGVDMINVGREALMSLGCIQAQKCHTDACPTGIATHNWWLTRGFDVGLKSVRFANYLKAFHKELGEIIRATGNHTPEELSMTDVALHTGDMTGIQPLRDLFGYEKTIIQ